MLKLYFHDKNDFSPFLTPRTNILREDDDPFLFTISDRLSVKDL